MSTRLQAPKRVRRGPVRDPRAVPLSAMPATERRLNLAGISSMHVIEDCADDPPRNRPEAFLRALRSALREPRNSNR